MGRGDLSDAEWERLRPLLPVSNRRLRQVAGPPPAGDRRNLHRVRTGAQWRDLPQRFGPWKAVHERPRLWSADGTSEHLLQQVQAATEVDRPDMSSPSVSSASAAGRHQEPRPAACLPADRGTCDTS
ncbi:transposase [Streptomyces peucetius]|uniref:transposase n=1 Tax=Streptomyces peucetius TaxID=1950 RepID=UPI0039B01218